MGEGRFWYRDKGIWTAAGPERLLEQLSPVTALVGGGGKSTLMDCLARAAQDRGWPTAAMTTTRIWQPETFCTSPEECGACWRDGRYALCGRAAPQPGKLMEPEEAQYRWLLENSRLLLVEADGSKHRPCKAPADYEPVLPAECGCVLGVMGLSALDRPVEECCFRPELVCRLLGCDGGHLLTQEDMARILVSGEGTAKQVGERKYWVVLNQCDDEERLARGMAVAHALEERGHRSTVLTRLK